MDQPLLVDAAPAVLLSSQLLTDQELSTLCAALKEAFSQDAAGHAFKMQLWKLREELFGKVIYPSHVAAILNCFPPEHRAVTVQELYERQHIVEAPVGERSLAELLAATDDGTCCLSRTEATTLQLQVDATAQQALRFLPEGTTLPSSVPLAAISTARFEAFDLSPPTAPPLPSGEESMQMPVIAMHFDGRVATVVGDAGTLSVSDVLVSACKRFQVAPFDGSKHFLLMVWPTRRALADLETPLSLLGIPPWARILWLERPQSSQHEEKKPANPRTAGLHFERVRSTFFPFCDVGQMQISKGELRNFVWNLNIDEDTFDKLWKRLDTRSHGFLDIDDLLHLIGRAHLLYPHVPIDALLYEAAVVILRPAIGGTQPAAHFDAVLAETPRGVGVKGACNRHGCSYTCSTILQIVVVILVFVDLLHLSDGSYYSGAALFFYLVYLVHAFCASNFSGALRNTTQGMNAVCNVMEAPLRDHPHFHWHIQCYHYETRTLHETYKDSRGNTRTRTKRVTHRVNTWSNSFQGTIPSTDHSPQFVPDTKALLTEIETSLSLDFSQSNYLHCYTHWCMSNRFDIHHEESRREWLPSRKDAIIAEWVAGAKPCWLRSSCYALATFLLCSSCFRLRSQSRLGAQDYIYHKKCYRIDYFPQSGGHHGAAAFLGGLATGVTMAAAISRGGMVF